MHNEYQLILSGKKNKNKRKARKKPFNSNPNKNKTSNDDSEDNSICTFDIKNKSYNKKNIYVNKKYDKPNPKSKKMDMIIKGKYLKKALK